MARAASQILSVVSFHGYRLTCALGREMHGLHRDVIRMGGNVVRQHQDRRLAVAQEIARIDHRHRDIGPAGVPSHLAPVSVQSAG